MSCGYPYCGGNAPECRTCTTPYRAAAAAPGRAAPQSSTARFGGIEAMKNCRNAAFLKSKGGLPSRGLAPRLVRGESESGDSMTTHCTHPNPTRIARDDMNKMSKWTPTTDLLMLRRMGKLMEELGELQSVAARCVIQGIDEIDPGSGKVNRQRLIDELADVKAQCHVTIQALNLPEQEIWVRENEKIRQMGEWEVLLLTDEGAPQ